MHPAANERRNVWGDARNARRVPRQIKEEGCLSAALFYSRRDKEVINAASTPGTIWRSKLEKQAPLLRGCPDRGGERQAKGGAHALPRNVWGGARNARRVPRQIKEKGCLSAALFFYLAERGGV
ncbi:hypothetical protein DP16_899 [Stenotrophomonas maltophilia]|nr:hypothetical protein DP16_899 [Stenotrophomonas maltophilia]SNW06421.1 Uncharacterised protein [Stenotrophomonas maltophilia]